ncbi:hypothetical protein ACFWBF_33810 [Streptomyces sp. NPDC060028]|uniref:hypothetical protein n=1 Tax=Streptomyces sp. NPDC060028 TaxID=3347041 RepID=UPI003674B9A5
MDLARLASLVAATLATGLVAGPFFAFDVSVMPALKRSDDRTLIAVMQRVNVAILGGRFLLAFLGAPSSRDWRRPRTCPPTGTGTARWPRSSGRSSPTRSRRR